MKLINTDCLSENGILSEDNNIDMILADLPYRVTKKNGILLFHLNQCGNNIGGGFKTERSNCIICLPTFLVFHLYMEY